MSSLNHNLCYFFLLLLYIQNIRCDNISGYAHNAPDLYEDSCPDASIIFPCECIIDDWTNDRNLNCTMVEGEDELAEVFNSLPSLSFGSLIMWNNQNVKVLKAGVFGNVTFKEFSLTWGILEEVEAGALDGSKDIVTRMEFDMNYINLFPFETIKGFTKLTYLSLSWNSIPVFPRIYSNSLTDLWLIWNPMGSVPADAFAHLPSLSTIRLGHSDLTSVEAGAFNNLHDLYDLDLADNLLTHIPTGAFTTGSSQLFGIYIRNNQITEVEQDAFEVINGMRIYFEYNQLALLKEKVWRPLVEANVSLALRGNPLECGCDLAWLVYEPDLMNQVTDDAMCADGGYLHDLEPGLFEDC